MTEENIGRLIDKLERIAVNFWLMEMSADARSIEKLLDEVSPESRDRIGVELARVKAQRAAPDAGDDLRKVSGEALALHHPDATIREIGYIVRVGRADNKTSEQIAVDIIAKLAPVSRS